MTVRRQERKGGAGCAPPFPLGLKNRVAGFGGCWGLPADGSYSNTATPEELDAFQTWELVQYDYISGERYRKVLFE